MKKDKLVKVLAIIIVPGGIPIYLGYKTWQFGKWVYKKNKEDKHERDKRETDS